MYVCMRGLNGCISVSRRVCEPAQVRSSGACRGDISNHHLRLCDVPRIPLAVAGQRAPYAWARHRPEVRAAGHGIQ
jgi:hypothetical protein